MGASGNAGNRSIDQSTIRDRPETTSDQLAVYQAVGVDLYGGIRFFMGANRWFGRATRNLTAE